MEKYYRVSDVNEILNKLAKEPAYYHEGEGFYNGVCAVEGELMCLEPVELEEPKVGEWLSFTRPQQQWVLACSICDAASNVMTKYCSTCGAKMIKETLTNE